MKKSFGKSIRKGTEGSVPIDTLMEAAVLGTIFDAANEGAHVVKPMLDRLRSNSFGDIRHRAVFEAMQAVSEEGSTCDSVTVYSELTKRKQITSIGGNVYLM